MWPDSFDHPRRPVEWFMRCSSCGSIGAMLTETEAKSILANAASNAGDSRTHASAKATTQSAGGFADGASE